MRKHKSSRKKKFNDFSFYCPYLAANQPHASREPSCETIRHKKIRYSSNSTPKVSHKNLIGTYLPTQELRDGLLNKKKMRQSMEKKLTREAIDSMNVSLDQFKKSFTLQRKSTLKNMSQQLKKCQMMPKGKTQEMQISVVREQMDRSDSPGHMETSITRNNSFIVQNLCSEPVYLQFKHSFQIPGVRFKSASKEKSSMRQGSIYNKIKAFQPTYFTMSTNKSSISKSKHSEHWEKQRMANIDVIISRKCKNFQQMMAEYYQRANCKSAKLLFSFDSNDTWMKRVLQRRGWLQNKSKHSKAFHLLWTYKVPKQKLFHEQMVNHYPNSHKVTTKSFLNRMLKRYRLEYIQPKTFDLDNEKQIFIVEFNKNAFANFLRSFLDHFEFDNEDEIRENQVVKQLQQYNTENNNITGKEQLQSDLQYILQKCLQITEKRQFAIDLDKLSHLNLLIKKKEIIEKVHLKMIAVLFKFSQLLQRNKWIANCHQGGILNAWISKSKSSSKGAGISLSNTLSFLLKQQNRIIQKYIENALILDTIGWRKFDIRLWVLVKGGVQPKLYYYKEFYGRVCSEPYRLSKETLANSAIHLTNYAINRDSFKNHKGVNHNSVIFPKEIFAEIRQKRDFDFQPIFHKRVERMLTSLKPIFTEQVCRDASENHFQFFGFDLLVDNDLTLHLLEINLSAKCEERHEKLTLMLEEMGQGLLNIIEEKSNSTQWKSVW